MRIQRISSKNTSLNQLPKVAKMLEINKRTVLLDYGCGGYSKFQEFTEAQGGKFYGYDPYWKSPEENLRALNCNPNLVVCANVLNVIMEEEILKSILLQLRSFGCEVYIQVYEGDKTGIGKKTSRGFQRNQKAEEYKELICKYFGKVERKGNVFICNI